MRILQFIFAICAFATTCNFSGFIDFMCRTPFRYNFDYPFSLLLNKELNLVEKADCHARITLSANFESDVKFFVATGVIAMLYCLAICVVYTKFDELYKNNNQIPLVDFLLSVFIAVLWLSSSACWANSLSGMKHTTDPENMIWTGNTDACPKCPSSVSSFNSLNISVILGFLNFFLWAADLWFLYKETPWFQNARISSPVDA